MEVAYLAGPYSHPDPRVKEMRYKIITEIAYELMKKGMFVYSPLTHNVPIANLGIHGNWLTWKDFDHSMLARCDRLIVVKLPGWEISPGVSAEIAYAKELGRSIEYLEPSQDKLEKLLMYSSPL